MKLGNANLGNAAAVVGALAFLLVLVFWTGLAAGLLVRGLYVGAGW